MSVVAAIGPVVIAGGSGFLGASLAHHLAEAGREVVILSRKPPRISGPWKHVAWDARTLGEWRRSLKGAAGLVNLVGRTVDCIKTLDHQDEILRSRVEATRVLGAALRTLDASPPVWVQMSTAHIYGDPPDFVATKTRLSAAVSLPSSARHGRRASAEAPCPRSDRSFCGRASSSVATAASEMERSAD